MVTTNYCYCRKCGEPVTWFNFQNIWEGGRIIAREHTNCNAIDILEFKDKRLEAETPAVEATS